MASLQAKLHISQHTTQVTTPFCKKRFEKGIFAKIYYLFASLLVYLLLILSHKKFEFENRGPLPSDFGFQSFACPARGSKVEIYIPNSTYGFCCNPYKPIFISAKWSSNAIPTCTWQLDTTFIGTAVWCLGHEMVFCYQNCFDLLWEKIVLLIEKNFWNSRLKAENLQNFWDH